MNIPVTQCITHYKYPLHIVNIRLHIINIRLHIANVRGKTMTTVGKVRYLIDVQHVPAEKILLITFTRKAAESPFRELA